jgi:hypothetical protein
MKTIFLMFLLITVSIFSNAQTRYRGYLYTFQTGEKEWFEYTASTVYLNGEYLTVYEIFKPGSRKNRYTITAAHFKDSKTVTVMIKDEEYLLSEMDGSEHVIYDEPSMKPFGIRGDLSLLAHSAPNQLAVQFISNRFEYVRVLSFLGSPSSSDAWQYFTFNPKDRIIETKEARPQPVAKFNGGIDSANKRTVWFTGTKKFCDGLGGWYYSVTITGNKITLQLYADKNNTSKKDKVTAKETIVGIVKGGKIITKDDPEYLTNRFKFENGILYEVNDEGGYNEYQQCK